MAGSVIRDWLEAPPPPPPFEVRILDQQQKVTRMVVLPLFSTTASLFLGSDDVWTQTFCHFGVLQKQIKAADKEDETSRSGRQSYNVKET